LIKEYGWELTMNDFNIPFLWEIILKFFVAAVFILAGIFLIVNNEKVTKNLLSYSKIFEKPEIHSEKQDVSPGKLKFNRIMIYLVGSVFTVAGILLLLNLIKLILR
jgi:uncharacterized membrane protein YphA (DoxX/SURF4 family)